MERMIRLSRALRRFASFAFGLSVLSLVLIPAVSLLSSEGTLWVANELLKATDSTGLPFTPAQAGWGLRAFVLVPLAVFGTFTILSLGTLIRLLHQFESGEAFSRESARLVRVLGWVQVLSAPAELVGQLGMVAIARALGNPALHPRSGLAGSVLASMFFGGVVLLIAYVVEDGFRLRSEQELVI